MRAAFRPPPDHCPIRICRPLLPRTAFAATGTKRSGVTLTLWHNYGTGGNAVATNNLVAAFQKQNPSITIKMLALGLGVSVIIDVTIVRLVIVPSAMLLFGPANWWTPRWLGKLLPHVEL